MSAAAGFVRRDIREYVRSTERSLDVREHAVKIATWALGVRQGDLLFHAFQIARVYSVTVQVTHFGVAMDTRVSTLMIRNEGSHHVAISS